jgi:hypothetical protein
MRSAKRPQTRSAPFAAMLLDLLRGNQADVAPLIEATIAQASAGGQGIAVTYGRWAAAILDNGLGRYEEARAAALRERLAEPTRAGAPTSDWGSRLARALVSSREVAEELYRVAIDRSTAPSFVRSSPAHTCSAASGYAARTAVRPPASSYGPPTRC